MKTPIFVFSDDLDIFRTPEAVTSYLEPWITERNPAAFDSDGQVLKLDVEEVKRSFLGIFSTSREKLRLEMSGQPNVELFRRKLLDYLNRLDPMVDKTAASGLPLNDLLQTVIQKKGYTT